MKKRKKNFARAVMTCRELLFSWYYLCNDDTWIIILLLIGLKSQQKQISGIALLGEATSIIRRDATSEDCFVRPHVKTYSVLATVQTLDRYKDVSTINFTSAIFVDLPRRDIWQLTWGRGGGGAGRSGSPRACSGQRRSKRSTVEIW